MDAAVDIGVTFYDTIRGNWLIPSCPGVRVENRVIESCFVDVIRPSEGEGMREEVLSGNMPEKGSKGQAAQCLFVEDVQR